MSCLTNRSNGLAIITIKRILDIWKLGCGSILSWRQWGRLEIQYYSLILIVGMWE